VAAKGNPAVTHVALRRPTPILIAMAEGKDVRLSEILLSSVFELRQKLINANLRQ
jgi:hypothetical protein